MSGYAPGRDHPQNKEVIPVYEIVNRLSRRKAGYTLVWSAGHTTKNAARVKAWRANTGIHPAWAEYDASQYRFTVVKNIAEGYDVVVQRER